MQIRSVKQNSSFRRQFRNPVFYLKTGFLKFLHVGQDRLYALPPAEWGPLDHDLLRLLGGVSLGQRIHNMLEAQDFAIGLVRGRLCRRFPDLSASEINLKIFEEIARDERTRSRFRSLRRHRADA
jgi:hypothetical protein